MGERRGRKKPDESQNFLSLVRALSIETDDAPRRRISDDILELGRRYQLTAYDATYVELARRESAWLASFDDSPRRCAQSLKLKVLPTAKG